MKKLICGVFSFAVVALIGGCVSSDNQSHKFTANKTAVASPLSDALFETLATGCATTNLKRNKVPDEAILDGNKYVAPDKSSPALIQSIVSMPGREKTVLAHKAFPENLYVASSNSGMCNIFMVNIRHEDVPATLKKFFNQKDWIKTEEYTKINTESVQKAYKHKTGDIIALYSYKKGTETKGLNLLVTFQTN
jgi:hypothetical protein